MEDTHFRSVLAQWPSGVGVVTTLGPDGAWHGMTASSFCSVSLRPPLVSVCLGNHLPTRALVEQAGAFAISFLGKDQAHIGRIFAGPHPDRFAQSGHRWQQHETGCPVLARATGWLDCRVVHAYPGGDHTIFVGEVLAAGTPHVTAPLLFHSRAWGQLADPLPDEISISTSFLTREPADVAAAPAGSPVAVFTPGGGDLERVRRICAAAAQRGLSAIAYATDAFAPDREADTLSTLEYLTSALPEVEVGCHEVGQASPLQVRRVLQDAVVRVRPANLRVRLLAHHGLGLVNALVAMKSGVRCFDTGAGSVPAQDLRQLADQLGVTVQPSQGSN
ncbi:hypothetical protein Rhe02_04670 [Rhizocola hellebori]|uniref:Flavin reductase like domain-containing protein n=1 Tax=Rhizocola hellebori TaxID=1392758 RepID=A0A8J3Q262_9ACTN|nr:flavin reductase [Rhizocola hellebori]GIH02400.1 hypothetical protein Rhe02_04670 [Rhizocola hellebori]